MNCGIASDAASELGGTSACGPRASAFDRPAGARSSMMDPSINVLSQHQQSLQRALFIE